MKEREFLEKTPQNMILTTEAAGAAAELVAAQLHCLDPKAADYPSLLRDLYACYGRHLQPDDPKLPGALIEGGEVAVVWVQALYGKYVPVGPLFRLLGAAIDMRTVAADLASVADVPGPGPKDYVGYIRLMEMQLGVALAGEYIEACAWGWGVCLAAWLDATHETTIADGVLMHLARRCASDPKGCCATLCRLAARELPRLRTTIAEGDLDVEPALRLYAEWFEPEVTACAEKLTQVSEKQFYQSLAEELNRQSAT